MDVAPELPALQSTLPRGVCVTPLAGKLLPWRAEQVRNCSWLRGWGHQELFLRVGGCSSPEGQKPFRDSVEMSRLHLGIVISEKGGSLAIPSAMSVPPQAPGLLLLLTGPKAHHSELSHLSHLSCSNPPSSQP